MTLGFLALESKDRLWRTYSLINSVDHSLHLSHLTATEQSTSLHVTQIVCLSCVKLLILLVQRRQERRAETSMGKSMGKPWTSYSRRQFVKRMVLGTHRHTSLPYTHVFIRLSLCPIGHRTQDVRGAQGTVTPDSTQRPPKPMG